MSTDSADSARPPRSASSTVPAGLADLERSECLALLGAVPLGRVVHTHQALPA